MQRNMKPESEPSRPVNTKHQSPEPAQTDQPIPKRSMIWFPIRSEVVKLSSPTIQGGAFLRADVRPGEQEGRPSAATPRLVRAARLRLAARAGRVQRRRAGGRGGRPRGRRPGRRSRSRTSPEGRGWTRSGTRRAPSGRSGSRRRWAPAAASSTTTATAGRTSSSSAGGVWPESGEEAGPALWALPERRRRHLHRRHRGSGSWRRRRLRLRHHGGGLRQRRRRGRLLHHAGGEQALPQRRRRLH